MDIAGMSVGMHKADLQQKVGMSVMKMAMNNSSQMADDLNRMLESLPKEPGKGNVIDTRI